MTYLVTALLIFLLILLYVSNKVKQDKQKEKDLQQRCTVLDLQIAAKKQQLSELNEQINNRQIDRLTLLTESEIAVLDQYERSNIRIPADILEDMHAHGFNSQKEIFDYVENQRHQWKQENGKKLYKGETV